LSEKFTKKTLHPKKKHIQFPKAKKKNKNKKKHSRTKKKHKEQKE
jgi:hypothetical protein